MGWLSSPEAWISLATLTVLEMVLLVSIVWIMKLTTPLSGVLGKEFSGRDLIHRNLAAIRFAGCPEPLVQVL